MLIEEIVTIRKTLSQRPFNELFVSFVFPSNNTERIFVINTIIKPEPIIIIVNLPKIDIEFVLLSSSVGKKKKNTNPIASCPIENIENIKISRMVGLNVIKSLLICDVFCESQEGHFET
jgi:hypothetical protein